MKKLYDNSDYVISEGDFKYKIEKILSIINLDVFYIDKNAFKKYIENFSWYKKYNSKNLINKYNRKDTFVIDTIVQIYKDLYLIDKLKYIQKNIKIKDKQKRLDNSLAFYYLIDDLLSATENDKKTLVKYAKYHFNIDI